PSKPGRILCEPERDFWPFRPRPEYRPLPEPRPRPTRLRSLRAWAGLRFERFRSSGIGVHPHEVTDLPEHTGELRALRVLRAAADPAQAERAERSAVPLALADRATRLRDLQLRHPSSPAPARPVPPGPLRAASLPPRAPRRSSSRRAGRRLPRGAAGSAGPAPSP